MTSGRTIRLASIIAAFVAVWFAAGFVSSSAHEVPSELKVDMYVRPAQDTLHVLVRVPLHGLMGTGMPKEGIGYLSLATIGPSLERTALQLAQAIEIEENGTPLDSPRVVTTRISLPFDTSFSSYEQAQALLAGPPLPVDTQVYWLQGSVDAWLDYPIRSEQASFSIYAHLTSLAPAVTTALRFVAPDGDVRSFEYLGDAGRVWLAPRWSQVVPVFARSGFLDAVRMWELWLFAACLLIPWSRAQRLARAVAAFTGAFVVTGLAVAYGPDASGGWLLPLVESALVAVLSYAALENIVSGPRARRWQASLVFGVLIALGFSVAMRPMAQFGGGHRLISLLSFTAGALAGELSVLAMVSLLIVVLYRFLKRERLRTVVLSALLANFAWTVLIARAGQLPLVQWPSATPRNMVNATSWVLVVVVTAGCCWVLWGLRAHVPTRKRPLAGAEHM